MYVVQIVMANWELDQKKIKINFNLFNNLINKYYDNYLELCSTFNKNNN